MPPLWWLLLLDQENNEVNQKWIYQKSQFSFKIEEGLHGLKGNWIISTPNYKDKLLKSIVWHSSRNAGDPSPIRFKFVNNSQNHFHPVWLDDECIMYIFHLTLNYFLNFNSSMCQYSARCKKKNVCMLKVKFCASTPCQESSVLAELVCDFVQEGFTSPSWG